MTHKENEELKLLRQFYADVLEALDGTRASDVVAAIKDALPEERDVKLTRAK